MTSSSLAAADSCDPLMGPELGCGCGSPQPFNLAAWWRIGAGAVIAANSMTISLAIDASQTSHGERVAVHTVLFGLAVVSTLLLGWPLARNSARAVRDRRLTIEAMFVAGIAGAVVASAVAALTGTGDVYFEIVCILLVVYGFGQQLTAAAQDRALQAATAWAPELTTCTVVAADGTSDEIPVAELRAGQIVAVSPGSAIAADGVVVDGEAYVREAEMTGEFFASVKRPGDAVWAGTHCVDAGLAVRATTDGRRRRIDRIVDAVERARAVPSSLQNQADRLVGRFLPVVLVVAGATFAVWCWLDGWTPALFNAMAVLLVACPCALGLATPLAVWAAVGRLASRGLVVRGGDLIERLAAVDTAVFDKTGTLTEPRASLLGILVEPPEGLDREAVLAMVQAIERESRHPVAAAFHELAQDAGRLAVGKVRTLPGAGVEAVIRDLSSGRSFRVVVGAPSRLWRDAPPGWERLVAGLGDAPGAHQVAVTVDGEVVAAALVDERLRSSWPDALAHLHRLGLGSVVMTGDRAERARATAVHRVLAGMTPEAKLEHVRRLQADGRRVLFVGDGVNDAAAMAASDASVGVATGAELAAEVGDVTWYGHDLRAVAWAVETARATVRTIRANLLFAAFYNVAGIALAAAGVLHPVAAAVLMTCSSLVVTWRAIGGLQEEQQEAVGRAAAVRPPGPDLEEAPA